MSNTVAVLILTEVHLRKEGVAVGVGLHSAAGWTSVRFEEQEVFSQSYPTTKLLIFLHDKDIFSGAPPGEVPTLVTEFLKKLISHEKRLARTAVEVLVIAHKGSVVWEQLSDIAAYATFTGGQSNIVFGRTARYLRDPSELNLYQLLMLARRARLVQRFARVRTSLETSKRIDEKMRQRTIKELMKLDRLVASMCDGNCHPRSWTAAFLSKWEEVKRFLEEKGAAGSNWKLLAPHLNFLTKMLDELVME